MNTFKIIIGIILIIAAINVLITMAGDERGAGLAGAFTGFIIVGGLGGWSIYSGSKGNKK